MSEQVQKMLSQLVKTQLEKKSSKKIENKKEPSFLLQKHSLSQEEMDLQSEKLRLAEEKMIAGLQVSQEERWAIYRRLIIENIAKILMIAFYCIIGFLAMFKFGIMILSLLQNFLHGLFITTPTVISK